jgi:hypothetical protein
VIAFVAARRLLARRWYGHPAAAWGYVALVGLGLLVAVGRFFLYPVI